MSLFQSVPWETNAAVESLCESLLKKSSIKSAKIKKKLSKQKNSNTVKTTDNRNDKMITVDNNMNLKLKEKLTKKWKKKKSEHKMPHAKNSEVATIKQILDNSVKKVKQMRHKNGGVSSNKDIIGNDSYEGIGATLNNRIKRNKKAKAQKHIKDNIQLEATTGNKINVIKKKKRKKKHKTGKNEEVDLADSKLRANSSIFYQENEILLQNSKQNTLEISKENKQSKNLSNNESKLTTRKLKQKQSGHKKEGSQPQSTETNTPLQSVKTVNLPLKLKKKLKHLETLKNSLTTTNRNMTSSAKSQLKDKPILSLRQKMMQKLKAARFRYLNEQIYRNTSKEAVKIFKTDPDAFEAYHEGYRQQVKRWPFNPLDKIMKTIKNLPKTHVIADFGCGDARLAKSVDQKVHSFDLVAKSGLVTACDMAHVPLESESVDVAVFCLSLMGTNLHDYLLEANRVLKIGGLLKIAEVESRFENVEDFIENVTHFGFRKIWKDLSNNLFYFMDFKKEHNIKNKNKLPTLSLLPCLYKKR